MFDKGYAYKAPFAFKLHANTSHNLGWDYKGDFVEKEEGVKIDWEYKFRHHKHTSLCSILFSNLKAEAEAEFWTLPKRHSIFKYKLGAKPKNEDLSKSSEEAFPYWDIYTDAEVKYHGVKHLYTSIKLAKDYGVTVPTVKLSAIYKLKPQGIIMGASCTLDSKVEKPSISPIELLLGLIPHKNMLFYLKHTANKLVFPGKFTAGLFRAGIIEITWPKTKKDTVVNKVYQYRVQTAAEVSVDMVNENKLNARTGFKVLSKKAVTFQTMFDNQLKWISALTYRPSDKLNFILSSQFDVAKFKKDPKGGFYDCGFTIELLC